MNDSMTHLTPVALRPESKPYWRSLDELAGDEAFFQGIGNEFAPDADLWLDPTSRRNFLRIMGASLALAGVVGCSDFPEEKIIPYVNQPESVVPGKPNFYATAFPFCGYAIGALAESHEGRPTKIEGNPQHPASLGATNIFMQASILDLYDPDRSRLVTRGGMASSWGTFYEKLRQHLESRGGQGDRLRLLTRTITSPTIAAQLEEFRAKYPAARWHVHDPTAHAGCSARNGGAPGQAVYDLSKADVILSLDADFLFSDVGSLAYARQFIDGRRRQPNKTAGEQAMNRLYVVESTFSITGSMADHRQAVKPSQVREIARAIAARIGVESASGAKPPAGFEHFVEAVADDLRTPGKSGQPSRGGVGVVIAGDHQPPALQSLAFAINQAIGSVGKAVRYIEPVDVQGSDTLQNLVADMGAGKVSTLLVLGGNPAYDAPADVPFVSELQRLTTAVDPSGKPTFFTAHLGTHEDETSFYCQWHVPESHYLETWGDARAFDGSASIIQPLIVPLSDASRSVSEMIETLLGRRDRGAYEVIRSYWQSRQTAGSAGLTAQTQSSTGSSTSPTSQRSSESFETWWQTTLRNGVIENSLAAAKTALQLTTSSTESVGKPVTPSPNSWEVVFRPDAGVWDGQFANNPWLQELPRPFTKLVWDNAALIGYRSAGTLGAKDGDTIRIHHQGRSIDVPVLVVPGIPEQTLTLSLGYGRLRGGHVSNEGPGESRGYNAYSIRTAGYETAAQVEVLHKPKHKLVVTRSHHAMDTLPGKKTPSENGVLKPNAIENPDLDESEVEIRNRRIVRSGTLDDFRKDEDWVTRLGGETELREKGLSPELPGRKIHLTLYPTKENGGWDYSKGYQWAMSIDTSACIGCNACVIACQAENNIPVVGKDQCARQREMHWIRVDDWFGAAPGDSTNMALDNPQVVHMPIPCQHCENAPCEVVCPVGATTHSVEGINEMTYNRCIGTRYCSNNCPYKVRRFNFLLYADYSTPTRGLQYNPDVTVRSRGVMEKCTYCIQRINRTRMDIEKMTVRLEDRAKTIEAESPDRAKALRDEVLTLGKKMLDELQTACQQACPTEAIVFGDRNDPGSRMARVKQDKLAYTLLDDLTTQPRTSYMARLHNPNPELAGHLAYKSNPNAATNPTNKHE